MSIQNYKMSKQTYSVSFNVCCVSTSNVFEGNVKIIPPQRSQLFPVSWSPSTEANTLTIGKYLFQPHFKNLNYPFKLYRHKNASCYKLINCILLPITRKCVYLYTCIFICISIYNMTRLYIIKLFKNFLLALQEYAAIHFGIIFRPLYFRHVSLVIENIKW